MRTDDVRRIPVRAIGVAATAAHLHVLRVPVRRRTLSAPGTLCARATLSTRGTRGTLGVPGTPSTRGTRGTLGTRGTQAPGGGPLLATLPLHPSSPVPRE